MVLPQLRLHCYTWGPSINYVVSKSAIFDPLSPSLSSFYYLKSAIFDPTPSLPRRRGLWTCWYVVVRNLCWDHTRWHDDILTPFSWWITFSPLWQSMKTSSSVNWWTRKIRPTAFALFSKTLGRFFFCVLDNSLYNKLRGNEQQLHIFFLFN